MVEGNHQQEHKAIISLQNWTKKMRKRFDLAFAMHWLREVKKVNLENENHNCLRHTDIITFQAKFWPKPRRNGRRTCLGGG